MKPAFSWGMHCAPLQESTANSAGTSTAMNVIGMPFGLPPLPRFGVAGADTGGSGRPSLLAPILHPDHDGALRVGEDACGFTGGRTPVHRTGHTQIYHHWTVAGHIERRAGRI